MNILGIDLEAASQCDLKVEGALRYSLHPSTIVRCAVIGWVDAERFHSVSWERGDNVPQVWRAAVESGATALAFNYNFERHMLDNVLSKQGWPVPQEWIDPQPHAAAANLPTSLLGLALALGCPAQKDQAGSDLAKKMSFLEDDGSNEYDTPENRAILSAYCRQDVKTVFDCWQRVPKMIPSELALWQLDQKINARGVFIDLVMVNRMMALAEKRKRQLLVEAVEHSDFDLISPTSAGDVKAFLKSRNVELPKVARTRVTGEKHESETVGRAAASEIAKNESTDPSVRAVLENRMEVGKLASLAKLRKVEHLVDPRDGRLRNSFQFCAAHTGRWSSRGLQVHNFPRDKRKPEEVARVRKIIEGA